MMLAYSFVHPWAFLLVIVPLALLAFGRASYGLTLPFDDRPHRAHRWLRRLLMLMSALPTVLLIFAIIILARPQSMQKPQALRSVTNIEICLDVSGSMGGQRYRSAAKAISDFTLVREGDAMGLTLFGFAQVRWIPLTKDLQAVRNALPFANPEHQPPQMRGTAIGACLYFACQNIAVEALEGDRLIILVSDGQSGDVRGGQQYELAVELIAARCVLYYIHVAEDAPMMSEVAEMARLTGGEGLAASDRASLQGVFRHIDRMQSARVIAQGSVLTDDLGVLALAVLGAGLLHLVGMLGLRVTPW